MSEKKVATREEVESLKARELRKIEEFRDLKLHVSTRISENLIVTRVVGGWLYETIIECNNYDEALNKSVSTTFVPFDAEALKAMTDELIAGI